jgi:hypothetical protein
VKEEAKTTKPQPKKSPGKAPAKPVKSPAKAKPRKLEEEDEDEGGADDYDMPGQNKATPEENESLRIFYESLYR